MVMKYRWLGAAGLEFEADGHTLLIDPFFTRPAAWKIFPWKGVTSNRELIKQHVSRADYVLVTHPHYDHLMDVPEILRITGAQAAGSENTCKVIRTYGIEENRLSQIKIGDNLNLGPFSIEVLPAYHTNTPLDRWINGSLPARVNHNQLPMRLMDYRMDACFSFRITNQGNVFLVGNYPVAANVLFLSPFYSFVDLEKILTRILPRQVVPIHWDNFTQPLSATLQPMLVTSRQGWGGWPPVRSLNLNAFIERVREIRPETIINQPILFQWVTYESS